MNPKKTVQSMVAEGILRWNGEARGNPRELPASGYMVHLAGKAYAAVTPRLWNAVYEKLGLPYRNIGYVADPAWTAWIMEAFRLDEGALGINTAVGFKEQVMPFLDERDPAADLAGAANVVVRRERRLIGANTDGRGYARALEEKLREVGREFRGVKILVLGAGATGRAIALALAEEGARVVLLNRTVSKAVDACAAINARKPGSCESGGRERIPHEVADVGAVVSALDDPTQPLEQYSALAPYEFPPTPERIAANLEAARHVLERLARSVVISDIMLRKSQTQTLEQAAALGFPILDGHPMVVNQAGEAFWMVHGEELERLGITKDDVARVFREAAEAV